MHHLTNIEPRGGSAVAALVLLGLVAAIITGLAVLVMALS